jgi:hypothetical protein
LPIGLSLFGPPGTRTVLALAAAVETVLGPRPEPAFLATC